MINLQFLLSGAESAAASYADLIGGDTLLAANRAELINARTGGMSPTQFSQFSQRFPFVVTHYNDLTAPGGMGTGFIATVFKDTAGATSPGNLTQAIRGTDDFFYVNGVRHHNPCRPFALPTS